jgi:hypothetical protein
VDQVPQWAESVIQPPGELVVRAKVGDSSLGPVQARTFPAAVKLVETSPVGAVQVLPVLLARFLDLSISPGKTVGSDLGDPGLPRTVALPDAQAPPKPYLDEGGVQEPEQNLLVFDEPLFVKHIGNIFCLFHGLLLMQKQAPGSACFCDALLRP